jgi:hypothetical protein
MQRDSRTANDNRKDVANNLKALHIDYIQNSHRPEVVKQIQQVHLQFIYLFYTDEKYALECVVAMGTPENPTAIIEQIGKFRKRYHQQFIFGDSEHVFTLTPRVEQLSAFN